MSQFYKKNPTLVARDRRPPRPPPPLIQNRSIANVTTQLREGFVFVSNRGESIGDFIFDSGLNLIIMYVYFLSKFQLFLQKKQVNKRKIGFFDWLNSS